MPAVVAVKLRYTPKHLWFGAEEITPEEGDHVIVETERGLEMGLCTTAPFEVPESDLPAPLKPVVRIASDADFEVVDAHEEREHTMFEAFKELAHKYKLDMKPVRVEYLFGGDKAVFYFVSEQRVDFRELVRELASKFHIRVDMRQIGVRDEARIVGDLGHCGQPLCCRRFGGEFQPVSIRMAKEQDLPLNPVKISGVCGRLMCCLRHEFEAYKDFKGRAPKKGSIVETPLGDAKVIGFDTPQEVIQMRLEDGKQIAIPLGKMECDKSDGKCCCSVSREALESIESSQIALALSVIDREALEHEVKVENAAVAVTGAGRGSRPSGNREQKREGGGDGRKRRRSSRGRKGEGKDAKPKAEKKAPAKREGGQPKADSGQGTSRRRRRRRSSDQ